MIKHEYLPFEYESKDKYTSCSYNHVVFIEDFGIVKKNTRYSYASIAYTTQNKNPEEFYLYLMGEHDLDDFDDQILIKFKISSVSALE